LRYNFTASLSLVVRLYLEPEGGLAILGAETWSRNGDFDLSICNAESLETSLMLTSALPLVFVLAMIAVLGVSGNFSASPFVVAAQVAAVGLNIWARRSFEKGTFRVTAAPSGHSIIRHGPYLSP
jgi:hypothetical protein